MDMNTKTMHISLPESLIESAKTQAQEGKFSNVSDYVRSLIREDLRRREEQKLEQMLLEGVRSERGMEVGSKEWKEFRKRLVAQAKKEGKDKGAWENGGYYSGGKQKKMLTKFWFYIAQDNPQATEEFLSAIEEASNILSTTSEIGSRRYLYYPELQGLRFYPLKKFEKYLVFYRTVTDEEIVEIVRIVHGARDLPRLFGGKESWLHTFLFVRTPGVQK
jgi:plasmid stabilization system protein ParE/Arc/MetJ-type ribon-helix-helix transcriptional regulator